MSHVLYCKILDMCSSDAARKNFNSIIVRDSVLQVKFIYKLLFISM